MPKIGYAQTDRAGCQDCARGIDKGEMRVQKAQKKYQHFKCFLRNRAKQREIQLDLGAELTPADAAAVREAVGEINGKLLKKRQLAKDRKEAAAAKKAAGNIKKTEAPAAPATANGDDA